MVNDSDPHLTFCVPYNPLDLRIKNKHCHQGNSLLRGLRHPGWQRVLGDEHQEERVSEENEHLSHHPVSLHHHKATASGTGKGVRVGRMVGWWGHGVGPPRAQAQRAGVAS